MKIGVRLESMGLTLRQAMTEAGRLGVSGVQVDAVGDLAPGALSQTGRREFQRLLRTHNLELTAIGCPLRHGLGFPENQEARIHHIQEHMNLSFDLGPGRVVVQAGRVPESDQDSRFQILTESLLALGRHGDRVGAILALETGLEPGSALARMLECLDTGGLGVNFDPANLVMNGFDLYESLDAVGGRIVHSHAHDARQAVAIQSAREVPVGHGDIDWLRYLSELENHNYQGWLVVEQESGEYALQSIAQGVSFLKRLVRSA
jgi:sugar phosphate isomerase/epimerase